MKRPETTQCYKNGEIWNFLLASIFQTSSPNAQIWVFSAKQSFNKILPVPYFEFGHFVSKSINFLILAKFRMYPTSNVLISNLTFVFENVEPKSPNKGILGQ